MALVLAFVLAGFPAQAQFLSEFSKHSHKDQTPYAPDILQNVVQKCGAGPSITVLDCLAIFGPRGTEFNGRRKIAIKVVFPNITGWATRTPPKMDAEPISLNVYCIGAEGLTCAVMAVSTRDPFARYRCSSARNPRCASAKLRYEKDRKLRHDPPQRRIRASYPAPCFAYCGPTPAAIAKMLSHPGVDLSAIVTY